jgi:multiple sugar transport system permease protein
VADAVVLPGTIQASPPQSGLKRFYRQHRNLIVGLLFISPWVFGFVAFLVYPILYTVMISFTRYSGFGEPVPIGLENYQSMVNDDLFWIAVGNTAFYLALAVPIGVVVAMVLAIAMNQPVREVSVYRAIIYLPSILPLFALSFVYLALLDPNRGIFNQFLINLGFPNINWIGDPRFSKIALVMLAQLGAGQAALIFLAALKGIPPSYHEAAMLDGASAWRRFWGITLPMMTPVILYDLVLGLSLGIQIFTQVFIIFGSNPPGSPANSTMVYVMYLYLNGFRYGQMGYAAALALVLFVVTLILALLIFRWSRSWVHYEGA